MRVPKPAHLFHFGRIAVTGHQLKAFCGYAGLVLLLVDACASGGVAHAASVLHPLEPVLAPSGKWGAVLSAFVFWFDRRGL